MRTLSAPLAPNEARRRKTPEALARLHSRARYSLALLTAEGGGSFAAPTGHAHSDVEIGEAKELFQIGRYDLDCGGKQCHQSDVQRFTLHLSAAEMAILVPRNNKTVSVG